MRFSSRGPHCRGLYARCTARTQTVFLLVFDIENTVRHERKPDMSVSYVIQWGPEERRQNGFDSANRGRECCLSASRETTASARTSHSVDFFRVIDRKVILT